MAAKRRQGLIISLDERRELRHQQALAEASRKMIEAEHALFVALRLAGHRGGGPAAANTRRQQARVVALPIRPRPKRAA
jgi:hypothetical protein